MTRSNAELERGLAEEDLNANSEAFRRVGTDCLSHGGLLLFGSGTLRATTNDIIAHLKRVQTGGADTRAQMRSRRELCIPIALLDGRADIETVRRARDYLQQDPALRTGMLACFERDKYLEGIINEGFLQQYDVSELTDAGEERPEWKIRFVRSDGTIFRDAAVLRNLRVSPNLRSLATWEVSDDSQKGDCYGIFGLNIPEAGKTTSASHRRKAA